MDFANSFPVKSFWVGKPYKYGVQAINRMDLRSLKQDLLHIQERSICILDLSTLNADAIADRITKEVEGFGLSFKNCLGYSFDGQA